MAFSGVKELLSLNTLLSEDLDASNVKDAVDVPLTAFRLLLS